MRTWPFQIPDLDRLCVRNGFGGLQPGSNEAAPLDVDGPEHTMQRVRHPNSYCPLLLQNGIGTCVANAGANGACLHACLHHRDADEANVKASP